jgi:signal transduction histidine kinase/putative methionine-R-sulfoxide reductase with GAF domain
MIGNIGRIKDLSTERKGVDSRQINALLEISKAIASGLYLEDVLRLIVTVTANLMDSKICSLWILDDKDHMLKLKATQSMSEEYLKERSLAMGEGVVGQVALRNQPFAILDVGREPLYKEKELARRECLTSMLSVPMCIKDRVLGVINCYTAYPHVFSKMEEEMLAMVANQAAICIENSGVRGTLDIDEILRLVLEGVTKTIGFDRARLYLIDGKKNVLECRMAVGVDENEIKGVTLSLNADNSIMGKSIQEKRPIVVPDAKKDPRVNSVLKKKFNLHSLVAIPLLGKEGALGAIAADHIEPGKTITPETLESVMFFAQQAALAIQNASMYQDLKTFSQQMEEKIQRTTADLRRMEAQLIRSEKLAALGQLAAGIAHEIRNPLTSINILIHSLQESASEKNFRAEDLSVIAEEIERINLIVDQFLRFARPAPPQFCEAELVPVIKETIHLLRPQAERQAISIQESFHPLPRVIMDREQMKQVVLNLLINAVQAMPEGGELKIAGQVSGNEQWVQLSVGDSGPGIPPEVMKKLFDPFFSTKETGVGLGLSIAHRIVDQHRGRIEVESRVGEGTVFTVWLPTAEGDRCRLS